MMTVRRDVPLGSVQGMTIETARDLVVKGPVYVVRERLCMTADGDRLVPENDGEARYLWATPGDEVPRSEAMKYGLCTEDSDEPPRRGPGRPKGSKNRTPDENK